MQIRAGYDIVYDCPQPTPMLLMLERPSVAHQADLLSTPHRISFDPLDAADATIVDGFGNICTRIVAPAGRLTICARLHDRATPARPTWSRRDATQHAGRGSARRRAGLSCSAAAIARPTG